jgi:glutamate-5-semialdehyde dehydrogenase
MQTNNNSISAGLFTDEEFASARALAIRAQKSFSIISRSSSAKRTQALRQLACELRSPVKQKMIIEANQTDCQAAESASISAAMLDRLRIDKNRLDALAAGVSEIAEMADPIGSIEDLIIRPSGLQVGRMWVPLGAVLMIYESRPNVTVDAAALCLKTGNAVILRGGKEARNTNASFVELLQAVLDENKLPIDSVLFTETQEHSFLMALLKQQGLIDVAIPRGGENLIRAVVEHASVPVIQHFKGVCHVYVEQSADLSMAENIIINAKTSRPGVCNALEGIIVDEAVAPIFIPRIVKALSALKVEILSCSRSLKHLNGVSFAGVKAASDEDFGREFLDLKCTLATVSGMDEALDFIARHGSRHTESIVTQNYERGHRFLREVDASCVLVNASTRFNDGGELGLGAELGISTSKLHAYGPMGLRELCARKFVVLGNGEIR